MSDLRELYQDLILDHGRNPRNYGLPQEGNHMARGNNPLCGDRIVVRLLCREGRIESIGFEGSGCAISQAAASTMTEAVRGKTLEEADALFERFHRLTTEGGVGEAELEDLGKLAAFSGVVEFPARVKCATLPWHTLRAALATEEAPEAEATPVSTE